MNMKRPTRTVAEVIAALLVFGGFVLLDYWGDVSLLALAE